MISGAVVVETVAGEKSTSDVAASAAVASAAAAGSASEKVSQVYYAFFYLFLPILFCYLRRRRGKVDPSHLTR